MGIKSQYFDFHLKETEFRFNYKIERLIFINYFLQNLDSILSKISKTPNKKL